jgi:hypothetical protein
MSGTTCNIASGVDYLVLDLVRSLEVACHCTSPGHRSRTRGAYEDVQTSHKRVKHTNINLWSSLHDGIFPIY